MNKQDFPILQNEEKGRKLIYLDNSATSQKPQVVIDAITNFYSSQNASIHRGIYTLSENATIMYEDARKTIAQFIGALPQEIVFTSGTTQSLNLIAQMLAFGLQEGDEILITEMEHHSNLIPWQEIAKKTGCVVKFIPITKDYLLNMQEAKELITHKTKIVALTHMSNVLGTINPIQKITRMAHESGAYVVVDAAQSVPHMEVDVKELDCDFLAFSSHKMCGPTGVGVLYGKKELLEKLKPAAFGGGMVNKVTKTSLTWTESPHCFEAGTPNIAGVIGMVQAVRYLQKVGMKNIQEHTEKVTRYALEKLSELEDVQIIGLQSSKNRGPVISFTLKGVHPHDVAQILSKENIAVRAGHHCAMPLLKTLDLLGTIRASFYVYNTTQEIDALISGLEKVREVFK